ncbi:unnamed protein product [Urochloa decumbens]|uniref:Uncharacterized protein n=1 Tax=Urochloa decumbens TaxID=240449 RepID=A0ABC8V714_9POAL
MATHAPSRGLTFCSRSAQLLSDSSPPLSKPAATMSPGGGRVGGAGAGRNKNPPLPPRVHPRYIPKRGSVLKGIVRGVLRCFLLASPLASGTANSGDRRVRPAPAEAGGDGAEQGK